MRKMMKTALLSMIVGAGLGLLNSCTHSPRWELVWEENFDGSELDTTVWSRIPRGGSDWNNTMTTTDERCFEMRNGCVVLKGIVNDRTDLDSVAYLTGGIWTAKKHSFYRGRIEVRAKLQAAKGAWPAIWCLPFDREKYPWPTGGEVDIMERLNHDTIAYQTVHSYYTYKLGIKDNPRPGDTAPINPDDFNVYGADFWPDSVVLHVNGVRTFAYPRIETDKDGQFPFDIPQFLLIDMQLGGSWVGEVDAEELPAEMEVDWVRHYQWKE